jgi:hypothetical protein
MQTYEFKAKINADGKLEFPEIYLKDLSDNSVVNVVVVIETPSKTIAKDDEDGIEEIAASLGHSLHEAKTDDEPLEPAIESFRRGWHDAMIGKTIPISQLWDGIDAE